MTNLLLSSPGDSVGSTGMDWQRSSSFGQRVRVDSLHQVHITWMKVPFPYSSMAQRRMEWNFRYADGSYFGELDASPFTSGYGMLDVTRDRDPAMQRTVICYHFNTGSNAYYPFIDIDVGNGVGSFPNEPRSPEINNWLWPTVARVNNGNTALATDDNALDFHHLFVTTDDGLTWSNPGNFDSTATLSHFLRSSDNPGSNKLAFVNTRFIMDTIAAGQLDNDVYYMLSNDGGVTWDARTNITNYQPSDSVRAYGGVNAVFDRNDKLHIVWAGRHVTSSNYYDASKIFHWDEVSDTITVVSGPNPRFPGGWWGWKGLHGYGAWRMPADEPQLVIDRATGWLYCLWHGQDDTTDISLDGWPNGDIYGACSKDSGLTWYAFSSPYKNLTNTHTPGAPAGLCDDEDYMTANPFTVDDSIFITYIEDKDAGAVPQDEGDTTNNPVRMWAFHKSLISGTPSINENKTAQSHKLRMDVKPNPASGQIEINFALKRPGKVALKLYSADGRLVKEIHTGLDKEGNNKVNISTRDLANGSYFIILSYGNEKIKQSVIVVR